MDRNRHIRRKNVQSVEAAHKTVEELLNLWSREGSVHGKINNVYRCYHRKVNSTCICRFICFPSLSHAFDRKHDSSDFLVAI